MKNITEIKTPVYICDKKRFIDNINDFRNAIKKHYHNYSLGYSFKTNYTECFCNAVLELGEYAEVVSPMEYGYARSLGFGNDRIIYNGVIEDYTNKMNVAIEGGLVNIDSVTELIALQNICDSRGIGISVGVRLNFDIGNGVLSRFGIEYGSADYEYVLDANAHPNVKISAVHCHISQARSLEMFRRRVRFAAKAAKEIGATTVDIGGNMFGRMDESFKRQFSEYVPTFDEYAEAIGSTMAEEFPDEAVKLFTEDGTPVVSDAVDLLAEIISVKEVNGKSLIFLDTKREDVGASCITKIPSVEYVKCKDGEPDKVEDATVFGCTCVEIDYILRKYDGFARIGDRMLIKNIGAYSVNNSCSFITQVPRSVEKKDVFFL